MLFLGIETSCDETAAAVVEISNGSTSLVSEEVSSQVDIHAAYGGVVPEIAARAHLANLPLIVRTALSKARADLSQLSAIGVTCGPGLKGCLLMGVNFAKAMAWGAGVPLLGINHIEGHLLAACLDNPDLSFPFLALIVSGGHTEIVLAERLGKYHLLARTSDDAAGEAFDKSANLLGFCYPGGASLAKLADSSPKVEFSLPTRSASESGFSFSGLKTAISLLIRRQRDARGEISNRGQLAAAIQDAIVSNLCGKLMDCVRASGVTRVCVCGGVSANHELRTRVGQLAGVKGYFPRMSHCMDNGAMIAYVAGLRFLAGERGDVEPEVSCRWPIESLLEPRP